MDTTYPSRARLFGQPSAQVAQAIGVPPVPAPAIQAPAQDDAYQKMLDDNIKLARERLAGMQAPPDPTVITAIRGNRVTREIPYMEASAMANYNNAQQALAGAQYARDNYAHQNTLRSAQVSGINAEAAYNQAKARQIDEAAGVFSDPAKAALYLAKEGVPPDQARQLAAGLGGGRGSMSGEINGQTFLPMLSNPSYQYLRQYFDPNDASYKKTEGMLPSDLFVNIIRASPKEALDEGSPLAKMIMQGMQQRFPGGFGGYATSSPDEFSIPGIGVQPWFNQNVAGPVLSIMTGGQAPTWNWRQSNTYGKYFDDYIKRFNQLNGAQGIGVPAGPAPGLATGGG